MADSTLDAVVVGGGIAGLTATWRLRHRNVLLLESAPRLGGRLLSIQKGRYWLSLGAHLFPGTGSVVDSLARELGIASVPVTGSLTAIASGQRRITTGRVETYPLRLDFSFRELAAFSLAGVRLQRAVRAYRGISAHRPSESSSAVLERRLAYLDDRTFADFLGPLPPKVSKIFSCAAHRATAEPSEMSAGCGVSLFALVWSGRHSLIAQNLVGGASVLPSAIGSALGRRVFLEAEVTEIAPFDSVVRVTYRVGGTPRVVLARHVIVAIPAPQAAVVVADALPECASALRQISYGPFLSMALLTNESGPMPWDSVYAMATPGYSFDMFFNNAQVLRGPDQRADGGSVMVYAGGDGATRLIEQPDQVIERTYIADLQRLFPEMRGIIQSTIIQRWRIGNVFARPGRHLLQPYLDPPLGPMQNVHLAGDYFAVLGNIEDAAKSGQKAAERVDVAIAKGD
jgi:oxygen-dependent protoporphyrinogen oxidase